MIRLMRIETDEEYREMLIKRGLDRVRELQDKQRKDLEIEIQQIFG